MKYYELLYLMLVIFFFTIEAQSQKIIDNDPWCPPGANWTYSSFSATSNLYYNFSYEKDSTLLQKPVKVLSVSRIEYLGFGDNVTRTSKKIGQEYLYESKDSIYWYDKENKDFSFIYNFAPEVGDYVIANNSRASCAENDSYPLSDTVYITSASTKNYDNRIFNTYSTSHDKKFKIGTIVANIGSLSSPFPEINRMECSSSSAEYGEFYRGLACYSDSIRGSIQFTNIHSQDCHSIITSLSKEISINRSEFIIFPNPVDDKISIVSSTNRKIKLISIYNTSGKLIFESDLETLNPIIDARQFSHGLYLIRIVNSQNNVSNFKFLKN